MPETMDHTHAPENQSTLAFRRRLWVKLLVAYLVPVTVILMGIGYLAYRAARVSLENQLGESLVAVARAAVHQVGKPRALRMQPGEEQSRTYANLKARLVELREAAGVELVYLFDRNERALVDSGGRFAIGESIVKLAADRAELKAVFRGEGRASVLFAGKDGRLFKTGFAPVLAEGRAVAAVGVDGSARFFGPLADLGRTMVLVGAFALALVVMVTLFISRRITRPLGRLAASARAIGRGEFDRETAVETHDEIGVLAKTLNDMRESIRERDRQLQMMLSGIAHEVRNPLGGMALFAGLLREELSDDEVSLKHLMRIETELDYLSRVVSDFLDYARERPLELAELDPENEFDQIRDLASGDLHDANVSLETRVEPGAGIVVWDRERMRRALLNLVRNAIQASEPGGKIRLALDHDGSVWVISVEDEGRGIPRDKQDKVFESFYTTRQQGTGLGLALVKKVVEEHGGSISCRSEPGKGTTFVLRLPERKGDNVQHPDHR